ncbi:MAG: hypothetical protein ACRDT4_04725 [Micromonosporaceae bacterium]
MAISTGPITLHLNLRVGLEHGPEAHLLWAGTRLDGIGLRHWDIAPQTVAAVLERHPRLGLKQYFQATFDAEVVNSPGSRAHLYGRYLGANRRIARAPFPD